GGGERPGHGIRSKQKQGGAEHCSSQTPCSPCDPRGGHASASHSAKTGMARGVVLPSFGSPAVRLVAGSAALRARLCELAFSGRAFAYLGRVLSKGGAQIRGVCK